MLDVKDLKYDEKTTQEFKAKNLNVLVFINQKTKKKLYVRPSKKNGEFIELIPLSKEELSDVGIIEETIRETINGSELFDIDIQESVDETSAVQPLKRVANFDVTNAESMRAARKLADEQLAKIAKTQNQGEDVETIKAERDDYKEKLDLIATQQFEKKKRELGAPSDITSPEELMGYDKAIKGKTPTSQHVPAGVLSLETQTPAQQNQAGWGSHSEMVADLRNRAVRDPIAREALSQLMFKSLKGARETPLPPYQEPPQLEIPSELIEGGKQPVNTDIGGFNHRYREKKLRAMAEKGDASALAILNGGDF